MINTVDTPFYSKNKFSDEADNISEFNRMASQEIQREQDVSFRQPNYYSRPEIIDSSFPPMGQNRPAHMGSGSSAPPKDAEVFENLQPPKNDIFAVPP
jgi:hypothetical protein